MHYLLTSVVGCAIGQSPRNSLSLLRGVFGKMKPAMDNKLHYFVTGPSLDKEYGIAVIDHATGHNAVTMHFFRERADAERLAMRLNEKQLSISVFCKAFLADALADIL